MESIYSNTNILLALFEGSVDPIAIVDLNDKIVDVNSSFEKLFGYSREELKGNDFPGHFGYDDGIFSFWVEKCRMGEGIPAYQCTRKTKQGKEIHISISISPINDKNGNLKYLSIIYRNIDEEKKNRNKLEYQNQLLENVDEAIISTDNNYRILSWNNAAEKIYGYSAEEVIGKDIDELLHTVYLKFPKQEAMKILFTTGFWKSEIIQKNNQGKSLFIEAKVSLIKDSNGNIISRVTSNRDITERIDAYKKIEFIESRNRKLMDMAPVGISISKSDDIIYVNKKLLEIYGLRSISDFRKYNRADFIHPDDVDFVNNFFNEKRKLPYFEQTNFSLKYRIINHKNKIKYLWENLQFIEIKEALYRYDIFLDQTNEMESERNLRTLVADNVFIKEQGKFLNMIRTEFLKIVKKYNIEEEEYSIIKDLYYKYKNPEEEWHITKEHFEAVHQDFFKNLKSKYPNLTQNDMRHCAYIKMNYNTKEIARIFSISDKSVQKSRVRLKKKLSLKREDDLYFFIQNL